MTHATQLATQLAQGLDQARTYVRMRTGVRERMRVISRMRVTYRVRMGERMYACPGVRYLCGGVRG